MWIIQSAQSNSIIDQFKQRASIKALKKKWFLHVRQVGLEAIPGVEVVRAVADLTDTLDPKLHLFPVFAQLCAHTKRTKWIQHCSRSLCSSSSLVLRRCSNSSLLLSHPDSCWRRPVSPLQLFTPGEPLRNFLLCSFWMWRVCSFHSWQKDRGVCSWQPVHQQHRCRCRKCFYSHHLCSLPIHVLVAGATHGFSWLLLFFNIVDIIAVLSLTLTCNLFHL